MAATARCNGTLWAAVGMFAFTLAYAPACGSDDDGGPDAGDVDDDREACAQPGFTETGCVCASGAVGKRTCRPDGYWEACGCPPAGTQCVEGQDVQCFPCPGEAKGRLTKCLQAGTFDCACDTRRDGGR
jgi:hypothetical protein